MSKSARSLDVAPSMLNILYLDIHIEKYNILDIKNCFWIGSLDHRMHVKNVPWRLKLFVSHLFSQCPFQWVALFAKKKKVKSETFCFRPGMKLQSTKLFHLFPHALTFPHIDAPLLGVHLTQHHMDMSLWRAPKSSVPQMGQFWGF